MGFGTLFVGYFLLLNLTYYGLTDLIAALVMLLAFYKLWSINGEFRVCAGVSGAFVALGGMELYSFVWEFFFSKQPNATLLSYTASARYLIVGALTVFMLMGIARVADEVGTVDLAKRARITLPFCYAIFGLAAIFEFPVLNGILEVGTITKIAVVLLLLAFAAMCVNLATIYKAYAKICMPEDVDNDAAPKTSRFEFANKFRQHEEEKQREYAEYRLEKFKKKQEKGKKK